MRYYNNTIYVPFYFANRFMDIDFKKRTEILDSVVVHELSHSVWYLNGMKKVEELVMQYGEDIVLEIPNKWKKFK